SSQRINAERPRLCAGRVLQFTFLPPLRLPDPFRPAANDSVAAGNSPSRRNGIRLLFLYGNLRESRVSDMNASGIAETDCTSMDHLELLVQHRLGNRVRDLRVLVRQDGVILQGRAGTYHAKQLAQHAAMELTALPILANDIEVR